MATHRTKDDYLKAATEDFDRYGAANRGRIFTMKTVAGLNGMRPASIYQLWPSIGELSDDLFVYCGTERNGWQERLLLQSPEQPLEAALAAVARRPALDLIGAIVRCATSAWPADVPARATIAESEQVWLADCADWFAAHLAYLHPEPVPVSPSVLAVALNQFLDGFILLSFVHQGPAFADWDEAFAEHLAATGAAMIHELITAQVGAGLDGDPFDVFRIERPDEPAPPEWNDAQRAVLEGTIAAVATAAPGESPLQPARLVDLDRLARTLEVTPRRLYAVWPTTAAFNAELIEHSIRVHRADAERLGAEALARCLEQQYEVFAPLFISVLDAIVGAIRENPASSPACCILATLEPSVRVRASEVFGEWQDSQQPLLLAILQLIRYRLRADVAPGWYATAIFGTCFGAERLTLSQPALAQEQISYNGRPEPILAACLNGLFRSMTTQWVGEEPPDSGGPVAPPL